MSHDSQRHDAPDGQIDPAAVTEVLRDLRAPATDDADGTDDADDEPDRFLLADPDEPVVYVYEIPPNGVLEHVDTLPIAATEAGGRGEDDHDVQG